MSIAQILNLAASGLVAFFAAVFIVTYHVLAPWRRTPMGWHLMLFTGAIGLLGLYTIVVTFTGLDGTPATVLRYARTAVLMLVAALIAQRTWMVWTAQHPHKSRDETAPATARADSRDGTP